jgi:hypothetical protein
MHGTRRPNIVISPPAARLTIIATRCTVRVKTASKAALRNRQRRARQQERDQVRYFSVPVRDSSVVQIDNGLTVERDGDHPLTASAWRKLVAEAIAEIVRSALQK